MSPKTRNHWWVWTPEFPYVEPVLEDGTGPTYYTRDQVCVDANTKKKAISLGVKLMLAKGMEYVDRQRGDGLCPYTGVDAESAICKHGRCECDCERNDCDYCEECEAERVASVTA